MPLIMEIILLKPSYSIADGLLITSLLNYRTFPLNIICGVSLRMPTKDLKDWNSRFQPQFFLKLY